MLFKYGYKGDALKTIQSKLGVAADGIFGKNTLSAVKQFQQKNNLVVDGIIGKNTLAALNSNTKVSSPTTPAVRNPLNNGNTNNQQGLDSENMLSKKDVNDPETANKYINQFNNLSVKYDPTKRNTRINALVKNLETSLKPEGEKPKRISLLDEYKKQRKEAGLPEMEEMINQLTAQERDVMANLRIQKFDQEGKPIAMGVIEGRQNELTRQAREDLDFIQRQKAYLVDAYNSKTAVINQLMTLTEKDYKYAVEDYERDFKMKKDLYSMAEDEYEMDLKEQKMEFDIWKEARKDARANGEILVNTMIKAGKQYNDMDSATQLNLKKWGLQAGLGENFFKDMFDIAQDKPILTTIQSRDGSKVSIIFKDGTRKVVRTGIYNPTSYGGSGAKSKYDVEKIKEIWDDKNKTENEKIIELKQMGVSDYVIKNLQAGGFDKDLEQRKDINKITSTVDSILLNTFDKSWYTSDADSWDNAYEDGVKMIKEIKRNGGFYQIDKEHEYNFNDQEIQELEKELKRRAAEKQREEGGFSNFFNINPKLNK